MANPVIVNSANVIQFGFTTTFDLNQKQIIFDVSGLTQFVTGNAGNIQGIYFELFDASGLSLIDQDFSTSNIDPLSIAPYVVQIPNGFAQYGLFVIRGTLIDQDGTRTIIELKKDICQPDFNSNGYVDGTLLQDVDCDTPKINISEVTKLTYAHKVPVEVTKSGNFYYPLGTIDPVAFTFTPFVITGANVYTGNYVVKNTTLATYDLLDNVFVRVAYISKLSFDVTCVSKLVSLLCCIKDEEQKYYSDPNSARGRDAQAKINKIAVPLLTATVKEKAGQDASYEIKIISDILQCDCDCNQLIEPKIIGGGSGSDFSIVGSGGTTVNQADVSGHVQYTIASKTTSVTKGPSDLAFNIQVIPTSGNTEYKITFNYGQLASSILTAIDNDNALTQYLQGIVGATASGISLAGLDGGCVITIGNCSYSLIESSSIAKTITGIVINNVTHAAPTGLQLTNTTGIVSWLNGLTLGTFTAVATAGNITIQSLNNPAIVNQLLLTISGSPVIRQFTKTCAGLVEVLNAIIEYICDIHTSQIEFGLAGQSICTFNGSGQVVTTAIPPTVALDSLLSQILIAQCALYNRVTNASVTCDSIKALFTTASAFLGTDGLLGNSAGNCQTIPLNLVASAMLSLIAGTPALKAAFCAIVASCSAPTCAVVTNVSATLVAGPTCVSVTNITGSATA